MTKSRQSSHSSDTDAAKREAARTGRTVCDILEEWLAEAKREQDTRRAEEIKKVLKFLGCRNKRKRRKR
jgi:hypothetical protein